MITKFKIFEEINFTDFPQLGDYVIIKNVIKFNNLYTDLIGHVYAKGSDNSVFYIEYELPDLHDTMQDSFRRYQLDVWSPNKEEIIRYIKTKKFNI